MSSTAQEIAPAKASANVVYWLPLQGAVAHFEVSRGELIRAVKDGDLTSRRIVCADDLTVGLSSAELLRRYARRPEPLATTSNGGTVSPASPAAQALREQAARLAEVEAQLHAAERVERSLQRYADRLEAELAQSRREALALARALGRAEQLLASSAAEPRRIVDVR